MKHHHRGTDPRNIPVYPGAMTPAEKTRHRLHRLAEIAGIVITAAAFDTIIAAMIAATI